METIDNVAAEEIDALEEELWGLVETHKGQGPSPVLRELAKRILTERELICRYLEKVGYDMAPNDIRAKEHLR